MLAAGSVAYATIPDSNSVIHSCYVTKGGSLRVIDPGAGESCNPKESALDWNAQGPTGPAGPARAQGPTGPAGPPRRRRPQGRVGGARHPRQAENHGAGHLLARWGRPDRDVSTRQAP